MSADVRRMVAHLKEGSRCADCGRELFIADQGEFDHLPDAAPKVAAVSDLVRQGASRATVTEELDKCELVCSGCHKLRTALRRHDAHVAAGEFADVDAGIAAREDELDAHVQAAEDADADRERDDD